MCHVGSSDHAVISVLFQMKISAFNLLLELRGVYSVVLLFDKLGTTKQLDTSGSIAVDAIPSSVSHSC